MSLSPRSLRSVSLRRPSFFNFSWRTVSSASSNHLPPGCISALLPDEIDTYQSCSPKTNVRMTRLLKGLACSTAEVLRDSTSGVRAIRIGNNEVVAPGMVAGDTIYERHFYPQLVNVISSTGPRVILLSNPGTGKSLFQFYFLARFVNPALFAGDGGDAQLPTDMKTFGSALPPKVVVREVLPSSIEVWFLQQQVVQVIFGVPVAKVLGCFDPTTTLYFFEPMKTAGIEPYADEFQVELSTLATVSPDRSRYHEFSKVASTKYMPVFTEEELLAIGRDMRTRQGFRSSLTTLYTDDAICDRFKMFNGIVRYVLPQKAEELKEAVQKCAAAKVKIDPSQVFEGDLENKELTHFAFMYDVDKVTFSKKGLTVVNDEVLKELTERFNEISLIDRLRKLKRYSEMGYDPNCGVPWVCFETVVVNYLTSTNGVNWHMRRSSSSADGDTGKKPRKTRKSKLNAEIVESELPWVPMQLQMDKIIEGKVPTYADMVPKVLYKSLVGTFSFCDIVYKDEVEGKLVCIQLGLGKKGKRAVTVGAFKEFCERMGWGKSPSEDLLDRISYVFVPEPRLADQAKVVFRKGVGLSSYTIWRVSANYSSGN